MKRSIAKRHHLSEKMLRVRVVRQTGAREGLVTQVKPKMSKTIENYWAIRGLFSRERVLGARSGLAHGRLGLTGLFIRSAARAYRCLVSALNRPSFNADKILK